MNIFLMINEVIIKVENNKIWRSYLRLKKRFKLNNFGKIFIKFSGLVNNLTKIGIDPIAIASKNPATSKPIIINKKFFFLFLLRKYKSTIY